MAFFAEVIKMPSTLKDIFDLSDAKDYLLKSPKWLKDNLFGEHVAKNGFFAPYETKNACLRGIIDIFYAPFKLLLLSALAAAVLCLIPVVLLFLTAYAIGSHILGDEEDYKSSLTGLRFFINIGLTSLVLTPVLALLNFVILPLAALSFLGSVAATGYTALTQYYDDMTKNERNDVLMNGTF